MRQPAVRGGVPLKQIQEWLGHSDFAVTTNTYAHLEFNSKVASANAMTWINEISLSGSNGALQHVMRLWISGKHPEAR